MSKTASIINIPETIINKYGNKIDYNVLISYINEKKYYNKNKDNYGPFNGSLEAISFLNRKII